MDADIARDGRVCSVYYLIASASIGLVAEGFGGVTVMGTAAWKEHRTY